MQTEPNVFKTFKDKMLNEGTVTEANEQSLFDQALTLLTVVPIQAWLSFTWGKSIITGTNFIKDMKAAKTTEQKKSVIKSYFSPETLNYILNPNNLFSYTQNIPGIKKPAGDIDTKELDEAKPSAGLTKKQKSDVVKKAQKGEDIGKKGKSFDDIAKKAGGGEKGEAIAASIMWKNLKR